MADEAKQLASMVDAVEAAIGVLKCVIAPINDSSTLSALASYVQQGGKLSVALARLYLKVAIHTPCVYGKYADACSVAMPTSAQVLAT